MKDGDHNSVVVEKALESGQLEDSVPHVSPPAETLPPRELYSWEKKSDPYTDPWIRKTADEPFGLLIMEDRHAKGLSSPEEVEAVRFFWGDAASQLVRISDSTKAIETLKVYAERGVVTENQLDALARGIGEREVQRHREEAARIEAEARQEREKAEQEALEVQRNADIEERILSTYSQTHRELLGTEDD